MAPCPVTVTFVLGGPEVGFSCGTAMPPAEAAQVSAQVDLDALGAYREAVEEERLGRTPLALEEGQGRAMRRDAAAGRPNQGGQGVLSWGRW
jgi:hypothetical protein